MGNNLTFQQNFFGMYKVSSRYGTTSCDPKTLVDDKLAGQPTSDSKPSNEESKPKPTTDTVVASTATPDVTADPSKETNTSTVTDVHSITIKDDLEDDRPTDWNPASDVTSDATRDCDSPMETCLN